MIDYCTVKKIKSLRSVVLLPQGNFALVGMWNPIELSRSVIVPSET